MNRPETTLFMLSSADGKISTGDIDERDVDKDFPTIEGVKEGLYQYYGLEKETDLFSLNSGRVFAKVGVNQRNVFTNDVPVTFVVVDNRPHLTQQGISNLSENTKGLIVVTSNSKHPAITASKQNQKVRVIYHAGGIDLEKAMIELKELGIDKLTVQSGGTLNSELIRLGLIDSLSLVVAPALIGGKDTPTIMDGVSLKTEEDLQKIRALELISCDKLKNSYIHLKYRVIN